MEFADVSVVIPCYRCKGTIYRAIESVIRQTLLPREVILVDDFSNDDGLTMSALADIRDSNQHIHITIISLDENDGPATARNAGWSQATQPYIAFLDADDGWHPNKIEIQYGWMSRRPEIVFSFHRTKQISCSNNLMSLKKIFIAKSITFSAMLYKNFVPTRSVMIKKSISQRFYPGKRYAEDYLLWLEVAHSEGPIWLLDIVLGYSYKRDFGEGGLNGMLYKSYLGVIDTYKKIQNDKKISYSLYKLLAAYATIKFIRRVSSAYLRNWF